ncbi:MAG: hypothetical protein GXO42_01270 [bacterium]|nr:hypothetical protein [bacterium]
MKIYNNLNYTIINLFVPLDLRNSSILYCSVPCKPASNGVLLEGIELQPYSWKRIQLVLEPGPGLVVLYSQSGPFELRRTIVVHASPLYTENFSWQIIIPLQGAPKVLYVYPRDYTYTIGKYSIFLTFDDRPNLIVVVYEIRRPPLLLFLFLFLLCLELLLIFMLVASVAKRAKFRAYLQLLKPEEKYILYLILKHKNKLEQKYLYLQEKFSKPKVTRILKELEERNIVVRKTVGKEKIVYIKLLR